MGGQKDASTAAGSAQTTDGGAKRRNDELGVRVNVVFGALI